MTAAFPFRVDCLPLAWFPKQIRIDAKIESFFDLLVTHLRFDTWISALTVPHACYQEILGNQLVSTLLFGGWLPTISSQLEA